MHATGLKISVYRIRVTIKDPSCCSNLQYLLYVTFAVKVSGNIFGFGKQRFTLLTDKEKHLLNGLPPILSQCSDSLGVP